MILAVLGMCLLPGAVSCSSDARTGQQVTETTKRTAVPTTQTERTAPTDAQSGSDLDTYISRESEIAVRSCISKHLGIGGAFKLGLVENKEQADAVCDDANIQLQVDDRGASGPYLTNRIQVAIAQRTFDVGLVAVGCRVGAPSCEADADKLDASFEEWATGIEDLLAQATRDE